MSRKLTFGRTQAFYSYNRRNHRIDVRVVHQGQLLTVSGRNLGEVKSTLLVLAGATGSDIYTLLPARSA